VRVPLAAAVFSFAARSSLAGALVLVHGGDDRALHVGGDGFSDRSGRGITGETARPRAGLQILFAAMLGLLIIALQLILR
jgi:hypothetical protein